MRESASKCEFETLLEGKHKEMFFANSLLYIILLHAHDAFRGRSVYQLSWVCLSLAWSWSLCQLITEGYLIRPLVAARCMSVGCNGNC